MKQATKDTLSTAGNTAIQAASGNVTGALISVVSGLFGGKKKKEDGTSEAFKKFSSDVGGGAFDAWVKANKPDALAWEKEQILPLFYTWLMTTGKSVLWWSNELNPTSPAAYVKGLTEDAYRALGVDYWSSVNNRIQGNTGVTNGRWDGWVMLPGGGTKEAPATAEAAIRDAQAAIAAGNATQEQRDLIAGLRAGNGTATAGYGIAAALVIFLLWLGSRK